MMHLGCRQVGHRFFGIDVFWNIVFATLLLFLASSIAVCTGGENLSKSDRMEKSLPIRGFLIADRCFVCDQLNGRMLLSYASVKDGKQHASIENPGGFTVAHYSLLFDRMFVTNSGWGNLNLHNLSDFLDGRITTGDATNKRAVGISEFVHNKRRIVVIDEAAAWIVFREQNSVWSLRQASGWPGSEFYYDYVPLSQDSVRLLLLSKRPVHAFPDRAIENPEAEQDDPCFFTSAKYQAKWDAKEGKWIPGTWSDPETLEVPFSEPFHACLLKDHYYFVTQSGKVYVSPPLKAGETGGRKVSLFWSDPQQPITRLLTHVDGESPHLTYAFGATHQGDKAKKPDKFYFALKGSEPKLTHFRSTQLETAEVDEPLKTMLEYSRLIVNGPKPGSREVEPEIGEAKETGVIAWGWRPAGAVLMLAFVVAGIFYLRQRRKILP